MTYPGCTLPCSNRLWPLRCNRCTVPAFGHGRSTPEMFPAKGIGLTCRVLVVQSPDMSKQISKCLYTKMDRSCRQLSTPEAVQLQSQVFLANATCFSEKGMVSLASKAGSNHRMDFQMPGLHRSIDVSRHHCASAIERCWPGNHGHMDLQVARINAGSQIQAKEVSTSLTAVAAGTC